MTQRPKGQPGKPSDKAKAPSCPSCGATTLSEASFCHVCGVSLTKGARGRKTLVAGLAWTGAVAGVIAVAVLALKEFSERQPPQAVSAAPTAPMSVSPPMATSGAPPDLSRMTPREAADRLFNRVMMASEQGNRAEAMRFVPMAIQAYENLPVLDRDAHYHLGLIYMVAGDYPKVDRQVAMLQRETPNHLLALVLQHDAAERSGDRAAASRALSAFAGAYGPEMATAKPEYAAHRTSIERVRAAAGSRAAPPALAPPKAAMDGAALFAANCAGCHGPGAAGSDKGPPLVHKIYEPSHHGDAAFYRAVHQGVRPHHWSFGAMPAIPGISDVEVGRIIAYVRRLQRAAGIE